MATQKTTAEYVVDQLHGAGRISTRKMFGEYAIYCDDKVVAFICDEKLYVKPTKAGRNLIGEPDIGFPYPGAKPHFFVPGDRWDEADWLRRLIQVTAAELPMPAPRNAGKPRHAGKNKKA